MPEIAEVARIVYHLRKSLAGKVLKVVKAQDDTIVFGKVGTSGAEFQKALTGKKVLDAGQQGKYFWLIMSSPPHPVFHFGMTGWFHIKGEPSAHYRPKETEAEEVWPPKFWKFTLETDGEPKVQAAFTDARRLGRVRLLDCAAENIRNTTPLKENGPDPVIDKDVLTEEWLVKKMNSKHVPVKALLLDQGNISGIGNWVGDEILYHAKLHPEQYSDTFSSAQLKQLHTSIRYVCQTAVDALGDSSKFPETWLFNHRWGKGKKDAPKTLPNGAQIIHLTVGGRTSCVVPSVQKKTGAVAGDLKKETGPEILDTKKSSSNEKMVKSKKEKVSSEKKQEKGKGGKDGGKVTSNKRKNDAEGERNAIVETNTTGKRRKAGASPTSKKVKDDVEELFEGRRRSGRSSNTKG